jgi:hypothetical protein
MPPTVDVNAIISRAESLCRRVAPLDLADTPLYILRQTQLPDALGGKAICDGFTAPLLDLYLQAMIGPAWRGRGACLVVNDTVITERSRDDLREAVELLQRRRQLRQQYDRLPELTAERAEVERQIMAADVVLEAAEKEHDRVVEPLHFRLEQVRSSSSEGEKAKQELGSTCTDPDLPDKLADVQLRLRKRNEDASDLRRQIESLQKLAEDDRSEAARLKVIVDGDRQARAHLNRAKQHERKAAECEATLVKVNRSIADLQREEASIREQMLVP